MKKGFAVLLVGCLVLGGAFSLFAGQTSVGGNFKVVLYDNPSGEYNGVKTGNYVGLTPRGFYLYIYHELTDKISIDIQPNWSASSGATPRFGSDVAKKNHPDDIEPEFHGFTKAVVNFVLPGMWEMSIGLVKPLFSWDYGHELFWSEQPNGGKWSCNNGLGAMHDSGIEFYKNFELGSMSLPFYFYVLNGEHQFNDNNKTPAVMATVEPEFGAFKLKGSFYTGRYNDAWDENGDWSNPPDGKNFSKFLLGGSFDQGAFALRSEYAAAKRKQSLNDGSDAKESGFYVKAFYTFAKWARLMLHYDWDHKQYSGSFASYEKYRTISPVLNILASDACRFLIAYDIADWERERNGTVDTLKFKRLTCSMRVTF